MSEFESADDNLIPGTMRRVGESDEAWLERRQAIIESLVEIGLTNMRRAIACQDPDTLGYIDEIMAARSYCNQIIANYDERADNERVGPLPDFAVMTARLAEHKQRALSGDIATILEDADFNFQHAFEASLPQDPDF